MTGRDELSVGYETGSDGLLTLGEGPKRISAAVRQLVIAPVRAHSQKPDEIYDRIEALTGGPYLEMFARSRRPGWDAWGIEVESGIGDRRWRCNSYPEEEIRW